MRCGRGFDRTLAGCVSFLFRAVFYVVAAPIILAVGLLLAWATRPRGTRPR